MSKYKIYLLATVLLSMLWGMPMAQAATVWLTFETYSKVEVHLGLGKSVSQAYRNGNLACGGGNADCDRYVECSGSGWYALVVDDDNNFGVSCGYGSKADAINRARRECSSRGGRCSGSSAYVRSGYDDNGSRRISADTMVMCGKNDSYCQ